VREGIKKLLARDIKAERRHKGLTQEAMAEQLHISPREYGRIEHGEHCPSAEALMCFLLMLCEDGAITEETLERFKADMHALEDE